MSTRSSLETVIEMASSIKDMLEALCDHFTKMPGLINKEHVAIASGQLAAVEEITQQKVAISEQMEANHQELRAAVDRLSMYAQMSFGTDRIGAMRDCVSILRSIVELSAPDALSTKVLSHVVEQVALLVDRFRAEAEKAKPLIETNRIVIEKAMYNHQESFRFWQEVSAEQNSTYDQRGQQKAASGGSLLQIKT